MMTWNATISIANDIWLMMFPEVQATADMAFQATVPYRTCDVRSKTFRNHIDHTSNQSDY